MGQQGYQDISYSTANKKSIFQLHRKGANLNLKIKRGKETQR